MCMYVSIFACVQTQANVHVCAHTQQINKCDFKIFWRESLVSKRSLIPQTGLQSRVPQTLRELEAMWCGILPHYVTAVVNSPEWSLFSGHSSDGKNSEESELTFRRERREQEENEDFYALKFPGGHWHGVIPPFPFSHKGQDLCHFP